MADYDTTMIHCVTCFKNLKGAKIVRRIIKQTEEETVFFWGLKCSGCKFENNNARVYIKKHEPKVEEKVQVVVEEKKDKKKKKKKKKKNKDRRNT